MLSRIIYSTAVLLATIAVILLALFSPQPYRKNPTPFVALSFYIRQPQVTGPEAHPVEPPPPPPAGALIFHHTLTEGPENMSRVVGKAQGFIIPVESFAHSAFNIIYLTIHTNEYAGSISIQAKSLTHKEREVLSIVGGTGSFAFVRGLAYHSERLPPWHIGLLLAHLQAPQFENRQEPENLSRQFIRILSTFG